MAFLDQFIAFSREPAKQSELFAEWMAERPRELFQELRVSQPILVLPGRVLVTKYHDVIDVLARDEEFGVDLYAPKMRRATGDFFLGMEDSARYEREVSIVRLASGRDDLPRLERSLSAWTDELLSERAATGQLDIVSDLARRVPARLVAEYFGASGVEEPRLLGWLRALFRDIFLNPGDREPEVAAAAATASIQLSGHLDALISDLSATAASGGALPDTVLGRCVRMQSSPETALDPTGIRRNIAGIIVGAVETTSECVANVIDFFLDEPELLMRATAVAREGSLEEFRGYVFEALRFNPQASLLIRIARTESVLARGTARETRVAKNTAVLVGLLSAMFDPEELDAPEEFNPARPARHYLHFGDGLHQCFGRHINALQLPIIVRAILRLPDLRRAGAIELDGPFPNRLLVNFKPPHT